jgi:hypothetical protein
MFENAFARLKRQVEPVKGGIAAFELVDDAQRLEIVLEAAEIAHAGIEGVLTGMTEWRMSEIVSEADRFGQILVEPHGTGDCSGNLGNLE